MSFSDLAKLFIDMTSKILGKDFDATKIYLAYPTRGAPGFKPHEDVVFVGIYEKDDGYAKQRDSIYKTENEVVLKKTARTRVWLTQFIAYGPNSHSVINQIKDGVFLQEVKRQFSNNSIYLVPDMPLATRAPEFFSGEWFERWDLTLTWNELYHLPDENVGAIELLSIEI